jgi:hypothetical protein
MDSRLSLLGSVSTITWHETVQPHLTHGKAIEAIESDGGSKGVLMPSKPRTGQSRATAHGYAVYPRCVTSEHG